MIQDIYPHTFSNEYRPELPEPKDLVFAFSEKTVLLKKKGASGENVSDEEIICPTADLFGDCELTFLFRIDEKKYYLYRGEEEYQIEGFEYYSTRVFRRLHPKDLCFAGMTAWHLYSWYRDHRFCGRCGSKTIPGTKERVLTCPRCGNAIYPVIAPAVIVGVISRNRLLLTRYKDRPYRGVALVAGFCEIGETVEETVHREVMEETGLKVRRLHYYKSQPWGFADNILMGYFCEVEGDETVHLDDEELAVAQWTPREEIGEENADLSLTADMIMYFKKYGEEALISEDLREVAGRFRSSSPVLELSAGFEKDAGPEKETPPERIRRLWRRHIPGLSTRKKGESAVLIPLVKKGGEYHILFEKRARKLSVQPGEICFPGGGMDLGETPMEAAIRETMEELLVQKDQIEILAALDPVMGPTGASIWPFAGIIHDYDDTWSKGEVDQVFTIPFSRIEEEEPEVYMTELATVPGDDFPYELIPGGKDYGWRVKRNPICFYPNGPEVIWGVTARMLYEFVRRYRE